MRMESSPGAPASRPVRLLAASGVVLAGDTEPLVLDEPVVCVADDQLGRARAGNRSRLAGCVSKRWADDSRLLVGHSEFPRAVPVHFYAHGDFDDASRDARIGSERERGHGSSRHSCFGRSSLESSSSVSGCSRHVDADNHGGAVVPCSQFGADHPRAEATIRRSWRNSDSAISAPEGPCLTSLWRTRKAKRNG